MHWRLIAALLLGLALGRSALAANEYISGFGSASSVGPTDTFPDCVANGCNVSTPTKQVTAPVLSGGMAVNNCTPTALSDGSTVSIALNAICNLFTWAPGASGHTLSNPTGATVGEVIDIVISQPASGGPYTVAWGSDYLNAGGGAFTANLNTGASAQTEIGCKVVASTPTLYCYGPLNSGYGTTTTAAPHAPSTTSAYWMVGLANYITPVKTGNIVCNITGYVTATGATTATIGLLYQMAYGTGTAPTNTAGTTAATGTPVGAIMKYENGTTLTAVGDLARTVSTGNVLITGLTPGTQYWVDLQNEAVTTAGDILLNNVVDSCWELE
jgi:hypothetical protein